MAARAQIPFQPIDVGGIRGLAPWTAAQNLVRLAKSVRRARAIIRSFRPSVILATGGYVSAPVVWAGAAERVPSVVYLPDLEPGWAIRATARWATRIAVSFPEVSRYFRSSQVVVTGYPVRARFYETNREKARQMLRLEPNACTVTVYGGSQGAHHINQAVVANLPELARQAQIIHITGQSDEAWAKGQIDQLPDGLQSRVHVFGYLNEELPDALAAADIAVARAGASSLGELPALGLPAILVPYPFAGRHQELNCAYLTRAGAAIRVGDATLADELVPSVRKLFGAPEQLKSMSRAAQSLAQPQAAERIRLLLQSVAREAA